MEQNFLSQFSQGSNVILQVSADDLRNVMRDFYNEEKERTEEAIRKHREIPNIDRKEASKILGVSLATLWHWAKSGYLTPVKIGTKVLYKASDIEEIMTTKQS